MGVSKFQRFLRTVAELDVSKDDLKRYRDFVNHKLHDLCFAPRRRPRRTGGT